MSVRKDRTIVRNNRTEVAGRVVAFLRRLYPTKTADHVAADVGLSVRAVEKWLSRESAPSLPMFGAMALIYGPEFVAAVFPKLTWLDPVVRARMAERIRDRMAEDERTLRELTDLM